LLKEKPHLFFVLDITHFKVHVKHENKAIARALNLLVEHDKAISQN